VGAPIVLWSETDALDQVQAFIVAACPEVQAKDIYRAQPSATPGVFGRSIVIFPLTTIPEYQSAWGAESDSAQQQKWQVAVTTAAAGNWTVTALGTTTAPFVAGPGDTPADIVAGLRSAVDALSLAVTTGAVTPPPAAFTITGDEAGVSLGVSVSAPVGGVAALTVVDDNIRRATYNWGLYRVRLLFRDVASAQQVVPGPVGAPRYVAAICAERVRLWLQASSLPVTNGLAYPYRRDQLQAAPARLSWAKTDLLPTASVQENGAWVRVVAMDVTFQVPVGMTYDVPSLDAMGLIGPPVIAP
jgi:hypothetical protein